VYCIPWFKHYRPNYIKQQVNAYKKAARYYKELLKDDTGKGVVEGAYHLSRR
jgi:perosamine synthetase